MPDFVPLRTSETHYRLAIPFGDDLFEVFVRWNSRDAAWYMDLYEPGGNPVLLGMKLVLGVNLGIRSNHKFFGDHVLRMVDSTDDERDAGFDDLNVRVWLMHQTRDEILNGPTFVTT